MYIYIYNMYMHEQQNHRIGGVEFGVVELCDREV